jgi:hypothetical protein
MRSLFWDDVYGDRGLDFGVEMNTDLMVTDLAQRIV